MSIEQGTIKILEGIREIDEDNPVMGDLMWQSFAIGYNMIEAINKGDVKEGQYEMSEYIEMVSTILGFDIKEMVEHIMRGLEENDGSDKEADQKTLDFITSDEELDDYERFLKQSKALEDLQFLSKEI